MALRNINVGTRAVWAFGLMGGIVLLLGLFALKQMGLIRDEASEISRQWLPSITAIGTLNQDTLRIRTHTLRLLVDRSHAEETRATINQLLDGLQPLEEAYAQSMVLENEKAIFERYLRSRQHFEKTLREILQLESSGQLEQSLTLFSTQLGDAASEMSELIRDLVSINNEQALQSARDADEIFGMARAWMIVTIVLAGLLTFLLAWVFTRSIVQPLNQAVEVAESVSNGDLRRPIEIAGKDEPARLMMALKRMQVGLRETVQLIADSSNQLASAAEELNVVTEDSTRGLHQQNQEIEQAATAVNEMSTAVEEVASNAVATSEASRESDTTTQRGRHQVIQTVDSIGLLAIDVTTTAGEVEQLAVQVRDISKVLDVIRSIAEQTNLLALNAAIEAARAGEAGRGFAVVADEVRALAHRTQLSTQEIEQMIGAVHQGADKAVQSIQTSNQRTQATLELAQAAGEALEEIAHSISQITERNLVIASASEEQAQVAREVDRNLVNIRDLSLQSAAGANQTNAASQDLARLAVELNSVVARFNT
ncbi:methyl-accepting chemotaxis protein [Pseudomonas sp. ER28]|uniref:methyl-accepting chemotaxis protein n=1 Tax=Pseudomonas TaxID=286 RepID=UPI0006B45950|nr:MULTISPECIES: methyl-accepting chemotaxis protein [Pseudomonas]MDF3172120.1 methyl-accepting chemotaxis protein [Pseudomonas sp. ER28]USX36229.1 methyl-accepting chemotaxis protein [Pseudomonas putida]